jgi:hypothetical protein
MGASGTVVAVAAAAVAAVAALKLLVPLLSSDDRSSATVQWL